MLPLALGVTITASAAPSAVVSAVSKEAFENETCLRFDITRDGDAATAQQVEYLTEDGTALAGLHCLARTGTARFAVGQTTALVDVPLLDNALLDRERRFRLVLTNASPGLGIMPDPNPPPGLPPTTFGCLSFQEGVIKDNELRPTLLDTSSAADLAGFSVQMPDGRYIVGDTMLNADGSVDASFIIGAGALDGDFGGIKHVYPDGRMLGYYSPAGLYRWRLVRLFSDGTVDRLLPELPEFAEFLAAQPDGKLLMRRSANTERVIYRVHENGSYDSTFTEGTFNGSIRKVSVRPDGKILVAGSFTRFNGAQGSGLVRLHANGTLDTTFPSSFGDVSGVLFRRNGKIIVEGSALLPFQTERLVVQFDSDGALDPSFTAGPGNGWVNNWVE